jgi:hypothetical protein
MGKGRKVEFEIECTDFPCAALSPYAHLRLGIQERDEVKQDVACTPCPADGTRFHFSLEAVVDPQTGALTLRGGYAHGPREDRFIYLCWGAWGDHGWEHYRRAKVPLSGLDRGVIERAADSGIPVRARIRMSNERGEPVAATVKPAAVQWLV